jgi:hypothetical protein
LHERSSSWSVSKTAAGSTAPLDSRERGIYDQRRQVLEDTFASDCRNLCMISFTCLAM